MLPALWPGDLVLIEKRPSAQLELGDIVLYERAGRFFLHRLVVLGPRSMTARGNTLPQDDPTVSLDCLLGVLAGVRRGKEWVVPSKKMGMTARSLSALLRRSAFAMRMFVRFGSKVRGTGDRRNDWKSVGAKLESCL